MNLAPFIGTFVFCSVACVAIAQQSAGAGSGAQQSKPVQPAQAGAAQGQNPPAAPTSTTSQSQTSQPAKGPQAISKKISVETSTYGKYLY